MQKAVSRLIKASPGKREACLASLSGSSYARGFVLSSKNFNQLFCVFIEMCSSNSASAAKRVVLPVLRDCIGPGTEVSVKNAAWLGESLLTGDAESLSLLDALIRHAKEPSAIAQATVEPLFHAMLMISQSQDAIVRLVQSVFLIVEMMMDDSNSADEADCWAQVTAQLADKIKPATALFTQCERESLAAILEMIFLLLAVTQTDDAAFEAAVVKIAARIDPERHAAIKLALETHLFDNSLSFDIPERVHHTLNAINACMGAKANTLTRKAAMRMSINGEKSLIKDAYVHLGQTFIFFEEPANRGYLCRVLYRDVERISIKKDMISLTIAAHKMHTTSRRHKYDGPVKLRIASAQSDKELNDKITERMRHHKQPSALSAPSKATAAAAAGEDGDMKVVSVSSEAYQLLSTSEKQQVSQSLDEIQDFSQEMVERYSHTGQTLTRRPSLALREPSPEPEPIPASAPPAPSDQKQQQQQQQTASRAPSPFDFVVTSPRNKRSDTPSMSDTSSLSSVNTEQNTEQEQQPASSTRRSTRVRNKKAVKPKSEPKAKIKAKAKAKSKKGGKKGGKRKQRTAAAKSAEDDQAPQAKQAKLEDDFRFDGNLAMDGGDGLSETITASQEFAMPAFTFHPLSPSVFNDLNLDSLSQPEASHDLSAERFDTNADAFSLPQLLSPPVNVFYHDNASLDSMDVDVIPIAPISNETRDKEVALMESIKHLHADLKQKETALDKLRDRRMLQTVEKATQSMSVGLSTQLDQFQRLSNEHTNHYRKIAIELLTELGNQSKSYMASRKSFATQLDHVRVSNEKIMRSMVAAFKPIFSNASNAHMQTVLRQARKNFEKQWDGLKALL
jgi:hypothetical protein